MSQKIFNNFKLNKNYLYQILTYLLAFVWLVNGFFCKILNFVPRHHQIVAKILGEEYSYSFTIIIGILEIMMAIWIISKLFSKINAVLQIVVIISMNILEFLLVPNLLLWGKLNIVFALLFSLLIYYYTFILKPTIKNNSTS